jgi:hypothetical protein
MTDFDRSIDRQNEFLRRVHRNGMSQSLRAMVRGDLKTARLYMASALDALKEAEQVWEAVNPPAELQEFHGMEMTSMRLEIEGIKAIQVGLDWGGTCAPGAHDKSLDVGAALYGRGCRLHERAANTLNCHAGQEASRKESDSWRQTETRGDA